MTAMKYVGFLIGIYMALASRSQDTLTTRQGDDLLVKVFEITQNEIKYRKYNNLSGPMHIIDKSEVFMIRYENGTKDVFSGTEAAVDAPAMIYLYRPKKFANSKTKIIVGTVAPDEVLVQLKNGSWVKAEYPNLGSRQFVTGIFVINPEFLEIEILSGRTYYFRCTVLTKGIKVMAKIEPVDAKTAEVEMSDLKEQQL